MIELLNIGLAGCGIRVKNEGKILLIAGCSIKNIYREQDLFILTEGMRVSFKIVLRDSGCDTGNHTMHTIRGELRL